MKRLIFPAIYILLLISCKKGDLPDPEIPEWLRPTIDELENTGECYGCSITQISYNAEMYYHLYCGYWSCIYCNLYDKQGNLVEWNNSKFSDFLENKSDESVIWKCGD